MKRLLPLLVLAVVLALAGTASASSSMDVGMADDRLLLHASDEEAARAVGEWRETGIDVVRIHARWVAQTASPHERRRPEGDPRDPDGPLYHWGRLDRAVGLVRAAGMRVMLTVTGSGPLWGTQDPSQGNPRHKPSPAAFADFAYAVARRYGPQVDDYIVWNEPNHELWLQPQSTCGSRGCTPYAPHLYRKLVRAADPAIRAADPGARVMLGALAPSGTNGRSRNARLRPLAFLRAMGCVTRGYRRTRGGSCGGFAPASGYGFAYHPHGIRRGPASRSPHADDAQLGDLGRLVSALDRVTRAGGLKSRHASGRFPLYLDEHGYQTNPPDRYLGVPAATQATWLQESAAIAWAHPRVRNLTQYVWEDEPLAGGSAGWQSGLLTVDRRPKPALRGFTAPFWAERRSSRTVRAWGQVRPGGSHEVVLERTSSSGRWVRVATLRTDGRGAFRRDVALRAGARFRFRWAGGTSSTRAVPRGR